MIFLLILTSFVKGQKILSNDQKSEKTSWTYQNNTKLKLLKQQQRCSILVLLFYLIKYIKKINATCK